MSLLTRTLAKRKNSFTNAMLAWGANNRRDFPWRRTRNPYMVLIAELLLRKTTAKQVAKIYDAFIEKYPAPSSLACADFKELETILRPLGMEHRRADLMIKLGNLLVSVHSGTIPIRSSELIELPGVGTYVVNSVLCYTQSKSLPAVDVNFIRVIGRVFGIKSMNARARNDAKVHKFACSLMPKSNSAEFNWAMLDFGALVCKAKKPLCPCCPVNAQCEYFHKHA